MSTHAHIAIDEGDKIRSIYCHNDGDIIASILCMFYSHISQVTSLIDAGSIRYLRRSVGGVHLNTYEDFRNEDKNIEEFRDKEEWFNVMYDRSDISFLYLYETESFSGMWWSWKRDNTWGWRIRKLLLAEPYVIDSEDYRKAKILGLTSINRWEEGIEHHSRSIRILQFLKEHDFIDHNDYFCWKTGGDGDNGESLMYQLDAFFEMLDKLNIQF